MSSPGGASRPDNPTPPGASRESPPAVAAPVPPVGAPIPAALLGPGAPLSAALGEVGLGVGAPGEDEADMGRLQAMLEARGFPPHLAGSCTIVVQEFDLLATLLATPCSVVWYKVIIVFVLFTSTNMFRDLQTALFLFAR